MDITKRKRILRTEIREKIKGIDDQAVKEKSGAISRIITETVSWKLSDIVLCFLSMGKEVDTEKIIDSAIASGKMVAIPRINKSEMMFHFISSCSMDWQMHPYGIREPSHTLPVFGVNRWPDHNVLVVTPGLAFDRKGNRLGRGKGYYDRFLSSIKNPFDTAGVCFSEQLVSDVPMSGDDRTVNRIVTEEGIINIDTDIFKEADKIYY
jgi:5-formyltetrahydrofolate cyclo-ligase